MKATAWHRVWFNFGGIDREVTIRPLGASEVDAPGDRHPPAAGPVGASSTSPRGSATAAPRATLQLTGRLGARPLAFAPVKLGSGRSATLRARSTSPHPNLWAPGHPALQTLRLAVPGESGWRSKVGLREMRWARRAPAAQRRARSSCAARRSRRTPRGAATRCARTTWTRSSAACSAIGANATRASIRSNPALLERLDAAGILVWQGIGPVDSPGAWTATTPALRRQGAAPRAPRRRAGPDPSERADLEPRQRGRQQRPRRRPGAVHRLGGAARAPPRPGAAGRRRRLGHAHARRPPGSCTATSTRSAARTTRAGTTTCTRARRPSTRRSPSWLGRLHATFPGKVLAVTRVRRRGEHAQPAGGAGRPRLPGAAHRPPHPHLPGAAVAERHARLEPPGLRAVAVVRGRLRAARGAGHGARPRDQPEGPVHLRRPREAGGRRGARLYAEAR